MDAIGLLIIAAAVVAYFLIRKSKPKLIPLVAFAGGVGVGVVGAAWYSVFFILGGL